MKFVPIYFLSVLDLVHFDADPDPGIADLYPDLDETYKSIKLKKKILNLFCKRYNTPNDFLFLKFMSLLLMCIKEKMIP